MDARLQLRVQRYGWDRSASHYEDSWREQLAPAQSLMLERAALTEGQAVLDVACGTGLATFAAARAVGKTGRVLATDLSQGMLDLAEEVAVREGLGNVTFARMDACRLDVPDGEFDVALCGLGLMYVPEPLDAFNEMKRALRQGGRVSVAVWGQRNRCGWAGIFPVVEARVESDVCPLFFQLGTGETIAAEMQRAGFGGVELHRITTTLRYDSGESACRAAFAGGPVAMAYSRFDEKTRHEAHADYLETIATFRRGQAYEIPGEFVIASGTA